MWPKFNISKNTGNNVSSDHDRQLGPFFDRTTNIITISDGLKTLSDSDLKTNFQSLKTQLLPLENGIDEHLVDHAFAMIREASRRTLNMAHYDVQLAAGLAMVGNSVAELATGEGKTLVATLPAAYFSLYSNGTHVMTVNAYLASRDCELMRPVYEFLGLTVNHVNHSMSDEEKLKAYTSDITYGVGSDFGFDYLRDQHSLHNKSKPILGQRLHEKLSGLEQSIELIQAKRAFAIVDEADSVMLDEASSALILSASSGKSHPYPQAYIAAKKLTSNFIEGKHFSMEQRTNQIKLLIDDETNIYQMLDKPIRDVLVRPWEQYLLNALKAQHMLNRDEHYVVEESAIQIVDEFTGRRFTDRTWSEGLHQAVEAKEEILVTEESRSMLKVARQHFFNLYDRLCGMTGTAQGCEKEFKTLYSLNVVPIPSYRKNQRKRLKTRFYSTESKKIDAIVSLVQHVHKKGMPILIGTRTVKQSEEFFDVLLAKGLNCQILNAKQDETEAELIAQAGKTGMITIATNMAGRGTDIALDDVSKKAGGLFVIVSEPHLSHRVDRQLIGRSARQGDPGCSVTFLSAEDEICEGNSALSKSIIKLDSIHSVRLEKKLFKHQSHLENDAYKARLKLFKYNNWMSELMEKIN